MARRQNMFVCSASNRFLSTISWHTLAIQARAVVTLSLGTLESYMKEVRKWEWTEGGTVDKNFTVVSFTTFIMGVG